MAFMAPMTAAVLASRTTPEHEAHPHQAESETPPRDLFHAERLLLLRSYGGSAEEYDAALKTYITTLAATAGSICLEQVAGSHRRRRMAAASSLSVVLEGLLAEEVRTRIPGADEEFARTTHAPYRWFGDTVRRGPAERLGDRYPDRYGRSSRNLDEIARSHIAGTPHAITTLQSRGNESVRVARTALAVVETVVPTQTAIERTVFQQALER